MLDKEKKEKEEKEGYSVGEVATQTEPVIVDNKSGKFMNLYQSHALIHSKLDKLMSLLD